MPDPSPRPFDCRPFGAAGHAQPPGFGTVALRVSGEVVRASSQPLERALLDAVTTAPLVVVDLHHVTHVDAAGILAFVGPAAQARRDGRRVVIVRAPPHVLGLLKAEGALEYLHVLPDGAPDGAEPARATKRSGLPDDIEGIDPLANPVNARVVLARAVAIDDDWLWLQDERDEVRRAWAPPRVDHRQATGLVEVYLDADDEVNGWRSPTAQLAINQRALDKHADPPADGRDLVCQDACGITWLAPAAHQVAARGEGCLTCGGTLALTP